MTLRDVRRDDFDEVVAFVREREWKCVTLASHLADGGKPAFPGGSVKSIARISRADCSRVEGVFLVTAQGIALHCVAEETDLCQYSALVARWLNTQRVRSVIGEVTGSLFLESLAEERPSRAVDYRLMLFDPSSPSVNLPSGALVRRCGVEDADILFPLQEGYEREEVLAREDLFDREASMKAFRATLGRQRVFAAESGGIVAAKAGTNAIGLGWSQIGGVYTIPSMRGQGLARALVRRVAEDRLAAGQRSALFVKLENECAKKAYIAAGFVPDVRFRISYA